MCNAAFWESKGMSEVFGAQPLPGVINLTHMVTATKWFSLSLSIIPLFFFRCRIYLHKPTCCLCMCNEYEFIKIVGIRVYNSGTEVFNVNMLLHTT